MGLLICEILLAAVPFMAGAAVFSFMNALAWRWPRALPVAAGRSACPACGAALGPAELVPVFSWLFLGGRCRHCGAKISPRYLLAELLGGGAALCCVRRFGGGPLLGFSAGALLCLVALGVLFAAASIDAATLLIPDGLNAALGLCGLAAFVLLPAVGPAARVAGALCVSLPMLALALLVPGGFGGGDIKLMAAAGLLLGWRCALVAALLAILAGGGYGGFLLAAGKARRGTRLAFGPFLAGGAAVALLFGEAPVGWYFALLRR